MDTQELTNCLQRHIIFGSLPVITLCEKTVVKVFQLRIMKRIRVVSVKIVIERVTQRIQLLLILITNNVVVSCPFVNIAATAEKEVPSSNACKGKNDERYNENRACRTFLRWWIRCVVVECHIDIFY